LWGISRANRGKLCDTLKSEVGNEEIRLGSPRVKKKNPGNAKSGWVFLGEVQCGLILGAEREKGGKHTKGKQSRR